ncbi:MAG: hypothetical protein CSB15_01775, partial [Clostridiales bacterium]
MHKKEKIFVFIIIIIVIVIFNSYFYINKYSSTYKERFILNEYDVNKRRINTKINVIKNKEKSNASNFIGNEKKTKVKLNNTFKKTSKAPISFNYTNENNILKKSVFKNNYKKIEKKEIYMARIEGKGEIERVEEYIKVNIYG